MQNMINIILRFINIFFVWNNPLFSSIFVSGELFSDAHSHCTPQPYLDEFFRLKIKLSLIVIFHSLYTKYILIKMKSINQCVVQNIYNIPIWNQYIFPVRGEHLSIHVELIAFLLQNTTIWAENSTRNGKNCSFRRIYLCEITWKSNAFFHLRH